MKTTEKKTKVIVIFLIIAIVLAAGFMIWYHTPEKRLLRQLAPGEQYLSEQNYEQAAAEFDKAIATDPQNERAYMGKVEACIGMGDYEQAAAVYAAALRNVPRAGGVWSAAEQFYLDYVQMYVDAGDYERAGVILEEGYALVGSQKIYDRIGKNVEEAQQQEKEELLASGMVEFPFGIRDITVHGYDLLGDHLKELREIYPTEAGQEVSNTDDLIVQEYAVGGASYYISTTTFSYGNNDSTKELWVDGEWSYRLFYPAGSEYGTQATLSLYGDYNGEKREYEGLNVPVRPGDSYEDWCEVMQIDLIKEIGEQPEPQDNMITIPEDGEYSSMTRSVSDETKYWVFKTGEYKCIYSEHSDDYGTYCELVFQPPLSYSGEIRPYHNFYARIGTDGIVSSINYDCSCVN